MENIYAKLRSPQKKKENKPLNALIESIYEKTAN